MRRLLLTLVVLLPLLAAAHPAAAADKKAICFPQVPNCIEFSYREFWTNNGGLQVFGLPLTTDITEKVGDEKFKVQYFERARFENHKENPKPYDMQLGRIGADRLAADGRDWQTFPKADPSAPHYFAETSHAIAPQFWAFWSSHGLDLDGNPKTKTTAESIALFGLPLSEPAMEPSTDGQMYLTQWFERAKFEYHPENKAPYDVLLGHLGRALLDAKPAEKPSGTAERTAAIGCPENDPGAAEGAQVWMSNPQPEGPGLPNTLCARLTVGGQPVAGANIKAVAHFDYGDVELNAATTGADGQARIDFNTGRARHRFVVAIDAEFTAPDGATYSASTDFRPRYPFDHSPPASGSVLPNIPAPAGDCVANAPAATEGAQAWVTNIQPTDPTQFNSICARLVVGGQPIANASVTARAIRPGKDAPYGPASTDANGVAELGFPVAGVPNQSVIYIDVELKAPDGKTYNAITYYRPAYPEG